MLSSKFYQTRNANATIARAQCETNVCENELYRVRFRLENLLENNNYRKLQKKSWMDRCWPCCRSWRKNRNDSDVIMTNAYTNQNYKLPHRTYGSSPCIDRNTSSTRSALESNTGDLINPFDPAYRSLLFKILEARTLDCLCNGYSKQNTPKQIKRTFSEAPSPLHVTSQPSSTKSVSSLESSTISAFPSKRSTFTPETDLSKVNHQKKSRLTVPTNKRSRSNKKKKRSSSKTKNKPSSNS